MAITLRNTKGSALTYSELDGNFTDLDQRIDGLPDSSQVSGIILADVDSAYVNARVNPANSLDSAEALILIDANSLDSAEALILIDANSLDSAEALVLIDANSLDSAETIALIDSAYVQARQTDYLDSALTQSIIDSNGFITLATLQTELAASDSFGSFQARIAAL